MTTPQDIAVSSSPTFAGLQLNGNLDVTGIVTLPLNCTGFANSGKLTTNASGQVTCANDVGGGAGGAPDNAEYLVLSLDAGLSNERALLQGSNISFTDGGANGNFTIATVQNPTFTTSVTTPLLTSAGALNITPGGALTIGAIGQTTLLRGFTTTITSSAGNNITLTSGNTIELQGNTNVTGDFDVSGTIGIGSIGAPVVVAAANIAHTLNGINCAAYGCYGVLSNPVANNVVGVNSGSSAFAGRADISAGNITQTAAFNALNPTGAGTVTNNYGVYVANQTKGTNDYGVYIQGADTYALWVDAGVTRLDGTLEVQSGSLNVGLASTTTVP